MDLQLKDKTVLVSGSTAGIGYAIARALVQEGAQVIVNGRSPEAVDEAIGKLAAQSGITPLGFAGSLATVAGVENIATAYPQVDILVHNLGIFEAVAFEDITDEQWQTMLEVNVMSGVRLSRKYLPYMQAKDWGRIIFIASESAVQIPAEMIHYGVSKTALLGLSRGLAEHLRGTGITVNAVLPGPTWSRGVEAFVEELAAKEGKTVKEVEESFFREMRPTSLLERFAQPEEVANLVTYVASPLSSATTGAALRVDGGVVRSAF